METDQENQVGTSPADGSLRMQSLTASTRNSPPSGSMSLCVHCSTPVPRQRHSEFCCRGCETVYHLLQDRGLQPYYELKAKGRSIRKAAPVSESAQSATYSYLDDPEFLRLYAGTPRPDQTQTMQFYLDGVHCAACVWLTEKVVDFVQDVQSIRLDLANSVATVQIKEKGSFGLVAEEFSRLGYRPHPVKNDDIDALKKREDRLMLIQMAVAGACTGNIMLLAISLYGGLSGSLGEAFKWLSLLLFLPVFGFSAIPFYRGAWAALRSKQVSIDIPIVLGILLGGAMSLVNLITGSEHVYFDSLSALVFLLLASRYVLKRAQQNALNASNLAHFLIPSVARKFLGPEKTEEVSLNALKPGDQVEVRSGECIPVDGTIQNGQSLLNVSLLTGESVLQSVGPGTVVFAGTVNQKSPLVITVKQSGSETRLGKILDSMEEHLNRRAPIVATADRISKAFVAVVLLLVAGVFFWGIFKVGGNWHDALNHALALAIVTCPCALALATPLAMSSSIARCAKNGILIKGGETIEKLSRVSTVYLDKTGTLTTGQFEVLQWIEDQESTDFSEIIQVVYSMETRSNHPVAKALVRFIEEKHPQLIASARVQIETFVETIGQGVSCQFKGHSYEIGRLKLVPVEDTQTSHVAVFRDGKLMARISLGDRLRDDSRQAVQLLRNLGLKPRILSGDSESAVRNVAEQLLIPFSDAESEKPPEEKSTIIQKDPHALMVGDGANDAVALASAYVGIAVHSGMEVSMRAADAYLFTPGVLPIYRILVVSRETMKVIYRNFAFSLLYNIVGGAAAIFGKVDPLFAAILMPLSAFTVLISSMAGTAQLRKFSKEETLE